MARTAGSKNKPQPEATAGFDLASLTSEVAPQAPQNHAGRGLEPGTLAAVGWLKESHANGDGTFGQPRRIVIPAGNTEYVLARLRAAAGSLGSGIDTEAVNVDGGKVEVRFRTRPKRQMKPREPKLSQ